MFLRPQHNLTAPPILGEVVETFQNFTPVCELHVGGRVVRTTHAHPFWVRGKGWTTAGDIRPGQELRTEDGWTLCEKVLDTDTAVAVYNFEVAEGHTYFVGDPITWGFALWNHNAGIDCVYRGLAAGEDAAAGLVARALGAGNTVASHVAGQRASQWICTTTEEALARGRFGANGVVEIDLSKVTSAVADLTRGIDGIEGSMISNWAAKMKEVLVKDFVPPEAIKLLP